MEVVGALASSLQIVSQCGQVTMTIIKWAESVRTVDERVASFVHEVNTLKLTYESLRRSLENPSMLEAARNTNRDVGGHLWTQMSLTLKDCERTMVAITNVLRRIQTSSNLLRSVIRQLRESLHSGELVRLREQVIMFNSSLQLPMQMITLSLQLKQQEVTTAQQLRLNDQLSSLRKSIEGISGKLSAPRRQDSWDSSTLHGNTTAEKKWFDNMEDYVGTAKKFLDCASVAASTLSAASSKHQDDESRIGHPHDTRRGSAWAPLTAQQLRGINQYVDGLPEDSGTGTPLASDAQSTFDAPHEATEYSDDDDIDLQILQQLLKNGHAELDGGNFVGAEDNFREAVELSQENDFGSRIACSAADIVLLLAECLVKQQKYDDAITYLRPIAVAASSQKDSPQPGSSSTFSRSTENPDKGQALSANHLLGEVYLKRSDYASAEQHAVQAFKGRKKLLGDNHSRTIESVLLVIDVYRAKGQKAKAEAHQVFLKPVHDPDAKIRTISHSDSASSPPSDPASVTQTPRPVRQRRPTFHFPGFRKTEKSDSGPTSVPLGAPTTVPARIPLLATDEPNILSTSPHDTTSSFHIDSDTRPTDLYLLHESSGSTSSQGMQHWTTTSDEVEQYVSHQGTRSSLFRAPSLFAAMSRSDMEKIIQEVASLCGNGRSKEGANRGIRFLQKYDPESTIFVHRAPELKENIKKSKTLGLSGTGHGFAPLHFFCSLNYEPLIEIDILLRLGADAQAVAYKAGFGKIDPFTPLTLAVDRNHENIVRMLLDRGATWQPSKMKNGIIYNSERDTIHPLLQACHKGYVKIVELLLESKMELLEDDFPRSFWHGNSLLHEACFRCDTAMVEFLTDYARRNDILNSTMYTFIGRPGQQDVFGVTPIMYTVDMRDSGDLELKTHKTQHRIACLQMLLEHENTIEVQETDSGEIVVDHPRQQSPGRLATDLHVEDKKGNTVFWYADESRGGDAELKTFLDEQSRRSRLIDI
ncbi:hypothetical protein H2198_000591 [Neophaeococcomyces mojaviensis]|uniref:Uncharacterized protein n=1 Tax=Neophaeococcomyces mojaviensis TaxID=3383035 RepID=A0ACC3AJL0_9EURO|nr:hypothetical protein H2198_000591 [Knufia sp. JES_112]